jgi:hypothetical protein
MHTLETTFELKGDVVFGESESTSSSRLCGMDCRVDRKQFSIGCSSSLANHSWLDQFLVLLTPP